MGKARRAIEQIIVKLRKLGCSAGKGKPSPKQRVKAKSQNRPTTAGGNDGMR